MSAYNIGRHEFGQNFLTDRSTIDRVVDLVAQTEGPILEIGPGDGALTLPMQSLRRPLESVEVDPRRAESLRRRVKPSTTIVNADFLRYRLPTKPYTIVGNLPFHLTTAILRRVLHADHWSSAVLMMQWEVARRRAAVGGATMMTAQWWPWYEFGLAGRVPAAVFTPRPSVDGGLITIARRPEPLVHPALRRRYGSFVHAVFTGRGHGLHQILPRLGRSRDRPAITKWLAEQQFRRTSLPRDLTAAQWVEIFTLIDGGASSGRGGPSRRRTERSSGSPRR
ncbi:23S ribosomal RNA methyltransferase Erm [Nocardia terpenica]|uniref:23S ribosomal RNA methyltransferase Erm n=1 Tax=Nocardia terpenica TaxID=455432 RepID=A0A291RFU4_9NOCA|nr:23S ribosomal RNA methyltransferase Erm [Nocardia terpenica]ATL66237.1 23S ribosomal RNA methyltransferase Erm [Nocardia terpenica]